MKKYNPYRFLFAGGGTGGHLYPAIAVADKIKELIPEAEIIFIGTKHKIESRIVPKSGYEFKSIWISGFSRKFNIKNVLFPLKLLVSMLQALIINIRFKPRVAIGTGAYVSGPSIWAAWFMGAKIMLLEQNSYPGITNRMLEKKADEIHIAFEDSKKYFRFQNKLKLTGNPVRSKLKLKDRKEAIKNFNLRPEKMILAVLGGSLGALSINEALAKNLEAIIDNDIQIIWQTGENYFKKYSNYQSENCRIYSFIEDMSDIYSAADIVLCRAGATTIAEAASLGLAVIFVPSINVAANHQYKNAKSLEKENAAILIEDDKLSNELCAVLFEALKNDKKLNEIKTNIKKFSKPEAVEIIAENAIKYAEVI